MAPLSSSAETTMASSNTKELSSPQAVRTWLQSNHPKQLSLLDKFEMELRLGRLSTSSTAVARNTGGFIALAADPNSDTSGIYGGISGRDRRLVTTRTVELLRTLIGSTKWKNAAQLMTLLRGIGIELHAAGGFREPAIGNVVRRVMCAVRDEVAAGDVPGNSNSAKKCAGTTASGSVESKEGGGGDAGAGNMERIDELAESFSNGASISSHQNGGASKAGGGATGGGGGLSLASMLWAHPQHMQVKQAGRTRRSDSFSSVDSNDGRFVSTDEYSDASFPATFYASRPHFRPAVMEAIQEIIMDLEDLHKNIDDQAPAFIHSGEVILTYARSKTVESFLKAAAAKKSKFQVVVCEGAPHFGGHAMAKSLAEAGIDTTVIHDSATFAIMARVNKVLLPAHAVMANGGLIVPSGSNMVALAAAQNSVPVVSITGMFKLCPMYPHEGQDTLQDLVSPSSVVDYAEMSDEVMEKVEFINPVHDYIPPQLINLYVTNIGTFQPSYIYRLLAEYYHPDDFISFE